MRIVVSGSSGLVGSALVPFLRADGHEVAPLVRREAADNEIQWDPAKGEIDTAKLADYDAVVNLAGESVAEGRWTAAKKERIRKSRVDGTSLLCRTIAALAEKPSVLINASAIGYYGDRGDEELTEVSAAGDGFLANVCREWEAATQPAVDAGIRVVCLRIGVVLSTKGGALQKMLTPFRLGAGGRVGSGTQFWSWITLEDLVRAIHHVLVNQDVTGPVNAVSPQPVSNLQFTKSLGRVLRRPTIFPMPAAVARIVLGEMADGLLLASARVLPTNLCDSGYSFEDAELDGALTRILT